MTSSVYEIFVADVLRVTCFTFIVAIIHIYLTTLSKVLHQVVHVDAEFVAIHGFSWV